jgi:glycosyltransferase involved in cell wall biosynthesis
MLGPQAPPAAKQDNQGPAYQVCQRGVSVASGDAEGLARGLARLIEDPGLRDELGRNGLEFVTRNYAKERLLTDIAELYRDLVQTESVRRQA